MGYHRQSDRNWANTEDIVLAPLALRNNAASGTGPEIELGDRASVRLRLLVTTETGTTPTLNVTVQTKGQHGDWYEAGTFDEVEDDTGAFDKIFLIDRFVRVLWVVAGTGGSAYTFSVTGEAA